MAKQSMIQREKKRERLIAKYASKRELIKEKLQTVSSFNERVELYKKTRKIASKFFSNSPSKPMLGNGS